MNLEDYHLLYPRTVGMPTLTQSGLLSLMLRHQTCKEAEKTARAARRQKALAEFVRFFTAPFRWMQFAPAHHHPVGHHS